MTRPIHALTVVSLLAVGATACSNANSNTKSGLSTASILGEAPPAASGDRPGITKDDPMARPVQVAWTAARAEKCGFNFNAGKLKSDYIAFEQRGGADAARLGQIDKTYDTTVAKIKSTIGAADSYCTEKTANIIKADLQRHLRGDYEANFPEDKRVAEGNFWSKASDQTQQERFNQDTFWKDYEAKKNGVKTQN
jgi:hypothetical protein